MRKPRISKDPTGRLSWDRNIPRLWKGRTSVTLTALRDPTLTYARFVLQGGGGAVFILMDELRRTLVGMSAGKNRQITFTLDPRSRLVEGRPALMWVEP